MLQGKYDLAKDKEIKKLIEESYEVFFTCTCMLQSVMYIVESLYSGHYWVQSVCPDFSSVLNSGIV